MIYAQRSLLYTCTTKGQRFANFKSFLISYSHIISNFIRREFEFDFLPLIPQLFGHIRSKINFMLFGPNFEKNKVVLMKGFYGIFLFLRS